MLRAGIAARYSTQAMLMFVEYGAAAAAVSVKPPERGAYSRGKL